MTAVSSARLSASSPFPFPWIVVVCWLAAALTGVPAGAQTAGDPAISVEWTVSPEALRPGSAFTLGGTVTIDPGNGALEDGEERIAWSLNVGPIDDLTVDGAACKEAAATSCETHVDGDEETVRFSGTVEDDAQGAVTAEIEITGTINDQLDRDTILFEAETCGTVEAEVEPGTGTPAPGRLPISMASPDARCEGVGGTIEVTIVPATEAPAEEPTQAPTDVPTEEPTVVPTEEPAPTEAPTVAPTATSTIAPRATAEPTAAPTPAPTATPTAVPTPTATIAPTTAPTATTGPPETPVVDLAVPASEAPQPTLDDGDDGDSSGLWIGVGSLLVLSAAAGAVLYQRRKLSA